jgi:hypothetical protein
MRSRVPVLGAAVALLLLAAVVAVGDSAVPLGEGKPLFGFLRLPVIELRPVTSDQPPQVVRTGAPDKWVDYITWGVLFLPLVLLGVAIVGALVLSLRRRRIRRPAPDRAPDDEFTSDVSRARLLRAAQTARLEFDEHLGGPAQDAVIAAWLTLEQAAATSGTGRDAHQTPTEFTEAVRAVHATVAEPLDALRRLYHRARFDPVHRVGRPEANAARAALDEIVRGLRADSVTPDSVTRDAVTR